MKVSVSNKNEHRFTPDFLNNLELDEKDQWRIVYKKINRYLHGQDWTVYNKDGSLNKVEYEKLLSMYIISFENAPELNEIETGKSLFLSKDLLIKGKYSEFDKVINDFIDFIVYQDETKEVKKQ